MWLFKFVHNSYSMWGLRRVVNHLGVVVGELVGFHYGHLRPVCKIDAVLEQTDTERVWNDSASVHHRLPEEEKKHSVEDWLFYLTRHIFKNSKITTWHVYL